MSLTQMTGFFFKQRKNNKTLKKCYFFVDSYGTLYYLSNMAQLNYYIKNSRNELELINKLEISTVVSKFSIQNCRISAIKQLQQVENNSFYHRLYFDLQVQKQNLIKQLQIFSTIEDDIEKLQDFIKQGSSKQPLQIAQSQNIEIEKKSNFLEKIQQLLNKYKDDPICVASNDIIQDAKLTYVGESTLNLPNGQGTLFYNMEGVHYKGQFKDGMKNGVGYFVDSNLDQLDCEFVDDILSGI